MRGESLRTMVADAIITRSRGKVDLLESYFPFFCVKYIEL